jgi:hypothetical protein
MKARSTPAATEEEASMYVEPRLVTDPAACIWYHTMELPEVGLVEGQWDLRATIDDYLGHVDFTGKRCLDVGTASGYLTFSMEARGAREIVSMDLDPDTRNWDVVPFADPAFDREAAVARRGRELRATQAGYWLAHRLLGSRARVHYGTAYDLPEGLGRFDVVVLGMMLPHVETPFRVLQQAAARSAHTVVVTQQAPQMPDAWAYFMPNAANLNTGMFWWSLSDDCLERMLGVLGFRVARRHHAEHACPARGRGAAEQCTTTVAERQIPRR